MGRLANLIIENFVVGLGYLALGKLGLAFASPSGLASLVWPASGWAIGFVWLKGNRVLPGIFLATIVLDVTDHLNRLPLTQSLLASLLIAVATTLQAFAVGRIANGTFKKVESFQTTSKYIRFGAIVFISCLTASSCIMAGQHLIPLNIITRETWVTWWLGDSFGVLLVAPLLFFFNEIRQRDFGIRNLKEFRKILFLTLGLCLILFGNFSPLATANLPIGYFFIPLVVWAAIQCEQNAVTIVVLIICCSSVLGTVNGYGPFIEETKAKSIFLLQSFMGCISVFGGILAAATTEKRLAREELDSSAVQLVPDIIACLSPTGALTYLNPAFEKTTGRQISDWIGKPGVGIAHIEDIPKIQETLHRLRLGASEKETIEYRLQNIWGEYLFVESIVRPFFKNGKLDYLISVTRDITKRKKAESELIEAGHALERAQLELEDKVEMRTAALVRANEQLYRSTMEAREFAYVASHDLQEPLRTISLHLQLLEPELRSNLKPESHESLEFVVAAAKRARGLINGLLSYTRLEVGDSESFYRTDLNDVLKIVLADLAAVIKGSSATVEVLPLPVVFADRRQIAQLFQNLISNAIKFKSGGIPVVRVASEETPEGWIFGVQDNGVGIDSNVLGKVFGLFARFQTETQFPGTGIGLAICKKIVERHGGRIWVESESGKGANFRFFIPQRSLHRSDSETEKSQASGAFD